jgi:hypothetical protein
MDEDGAIERGHRSGSWINKTGVAGRGPPVAESTNVSGPVVNFHTLPNGVPCARETYQ